MILRLAAAVAVLLGAAMLSLFLMEIGKAPWSSAAHRHLRRMKDRVEPPERYEPVTFPDMAALPRNAPLAAYAPIERRSVSLEGYVQRMERAPDGDIHLDFAPSLDPDGHLVPYLSAEITPQWHLGSPRWRFERLVEAFRPYFGGRTRWETPPRRVRLRGWLMYDGPYEDAKPVFGFPPHVAVWEIHPVARVEAWDDSLGRYVEIPR